MAEMPILITGVGGAEEEARSVLGTVLAQILTIVRQIVAYVMEWVSRFIKWAGDHPLASILTIANICIWVS